MNISNSNKGGVVNLRRHWGDVGGVEGMNQDVNYVIENSALRVSKENFKLN